jgi:hypothetical protein
MLPLFLVVLFALATCIVVLAVVPTTRVAPWVVGSTTTITPTIEDIDTWDEDYLDWVENQAQFEEIAPLVGDDPTERDWQDERATHLGW